MTAQTDNLQQTRAGIVLCGGQSSRMGRPKADLIFGNETMLRRVVRLLSRCVNQIVIVAAADQAISAESEPHVTVVRDELAYAGPLAGISVGLRALKAASAKLEGAYVTSCDVPFLKPEFIQELFSRFAEYDVVVPFDEHHFHPLAAVYRIDLAEQVQQLVEQGERRPRILFQHVHTCHVPTSSLRLVDPELQTLMNLNTPQEYRAALEIDQSAIPAWLETLLEEEEGSP